MPEGQVPLSALREIVGEDNVLTELDQMGSYTTDWTGRFRGYSPAVVRPGSTHEVSQVVSVLNRARLSLIPQGGNTGLVGGGVPLHGEIVLSLSRMGRIGDLDEGAQQITADAGVTLGDVNKAAKASGLVLGVDIASLETATVGGAISTNAGGLRMIRFGNMSRQLLGVEAVLADGSIISHLGGLTKDNTGYQLHALLSGAEGTLGIITRARLRLVRRAPRRTTVLAGLPSVEAAASIATKLASTIPTLEAVELILAEGLALVRKNLNVRSPLSSRHPAYLLIEAADDLDPLDSLIRALDDIPDKDIAAAVDEQGRSELWAVRELHTEAISCEGVPLKLDVSVPLASYAHFIDQVGKLLEEIAPEAQLVRFGHIADGNIHINVLFAPDEVDVEGHIFNLVATLGGSISAEHGIGIAKKPWLHLSRSKAEIGAGIAIKDGLDPSRILNPHAVYPRER